MSEQSAFFSHDPQDPWSSHAQALEGRLQALDEALRAQNPAELEAASQALHKCLADALAAFHQAKKTGLQPLSPLMRQKLVLAQTRVSGLQATVHRAGSSMSRTLSVLFPEEPGQGATYGALQPPASGAGAAMRAAYKG
ncbi:MAG TPA: hypothetical protein H9903_17815 [Candidatus Aquabacterium excrementipullorum]|nr:hypothetical protein [Candidatus Aquabacterium excrementipullorum]